MDFCLPETARTICKADSVTTTFHLQLRQRRRGFQSPERGGDQIHGFTVGAGGDVIDLHDVLADIGYAGSNPFADGYLSSTFVASTQQVRIDADGAGEGRQTLMGTLYFVNLSESNTDN